eukprot:1038731-Pyramimonas_sp.AAC.1
MCISVAFLAPPHTTLHPSAPSCVYLTVRPAPNLLATSLPELSRPLWEGLAVYHAIALNPEAQRVRFFTAGGKGSGASPPE